MGRFAKQVRTVKNINDAERLKKLKPSRALYTESERKELSRLRGANRRYRSAKDKIKNNMLANANVDKVTLESIQSHIPQDNGDSDSLRAQLGQEGYFEKPDYNSRDIREWMLDNGDYDLLKDLFGAVNDDIHDPNARYDAELQGSSDIVKYNKKISDNEKKIKNIKRGAEDRKSAELMRYMAEKYKIETGNNLLDDIAKGKVLLDKLSNPEQEAIRYAKNTLATAITSRIDLDSIPEEYRPIVQGAIYDSIMSNPIAGVRGAIRGTAALEVAKKYGTDAGNFAAGLADTLTSAMTGDVNLKPAVSSAFAYTISKSPMNKSLMFEVAEDLIGSGQSTNDKENGKMLARDVVVDIGKDVIMTGGNVFAAIPAILKDVLIDVGAAGIRKMKYDAKDLKSKQEIKKKEADLKKAQRKDEMTEAELEELWKKFEV